MVRGEVIKEEWSGEEFEKKKEEEEGGGWVIVKSQTSFVFFVFSELSQCLNMPECSSV